MKKIRMTTISLVAFLVLTLAMSLSASAATGTAAWENLANAFNEGQTIELDQDYICGKTAAPLVVPEGTTVTIDLNGYTLGRRLSEPVADGNIITVYGTLTIKDTFGGGKISGGRNTNEGGAVIVDGGTVNLESGCVSANSARIGGAFYLAHSGQLNMSGGSITRNSAESCGGAIYNYNGDVRITGGSIEENSAYSGGAVYLQNSDASLEICNGTMMNNIAENCGGAIYASARAPISISGRTRICGNSAGAEGGAMDLSTGVISISDSVKIASNTASEGGGIYMLGFRESNKSSITLSGNVTITGNTDNSGSSNLYMSGINEITITDCGEKMAFGVRTSTQKTAATQEKLPFTNANAQLLYSFRSDDEGYRPVFMADGLYLIASHELPVYIHGVNGIDEDMPTYWAYRDEPYERPEDPEQYGYEFAGWYKDPQFTEEYDFSEIVTEKVDLYARWEPALRSIWIKTNRAKLEYLQGEELDLTNISILGDAVLERMNAEYPVTEDMVTGFDSSQVGTQTLTVTFRGYKAGYTITVSEASKVQFDTNGVCEAPDVQFIPENGKVTKPEDPSTKGYTFDGWFTDEACTEAYDFESVVTEDMTLYAKMTPHIQNISEIAGTCKTTYYLNEPLNVSGMKIKAVLTDYSVITIPVTEDMITGFDSSAPGKKTLTITCGDKTFDYDISIYIKLSRMTLNKTQYYYDGKVHFPLATVYANSKVIASKTADNANVDFNNVSKNKKPGKYTVKATGRGDYKGTLKKTYKIVVKPAAIKSLTKGAKSFTVRTSKLGASYATGYQVRYSLRKNMSNAKTVLVGKKNTTVRKTVSNLKAGRKYYVQVRTYKTISGKKYYSAWSAKKAVTTK